MFAGRNSITAFNKRNTVTGRSGIVKYCISFNLRDCGATWPWWNILQWMHVYAVENASAVTRLGQCTHFEHINVSRRQGSTLRVWPVWHVWRPFPYIAGWLTTSVIAQGARQRLLAKGFQLHRNRPLAAGWRQNVTYRGETSLRFVLMDRFWRGNSGWHNTLGIKRSSSLQKISSISWNMSSTSNLR